MGRGRPRGCARGRPGPQAAPGEGRRAQPAVRCARRARPRPRLPRRWPRARSHGVTSAPPLGPAPRGDSWTPGGRVGAGEPGREETPASGEGRGPATPCRARAPAGGGRGRKRLGPRARGYSSPGLSQTPADLSSPVPSQETGTYFISLGQVRPRNHPPPGSPARLCAPPACLPSPHTGLGRTQAALPPPLRGKAAAPQTPGGPGRGRGRAGAPRRGESVSNT